MKNFKRTLSVILVVLLCIPAFGTLASARIAIDMDDAQYVINSQTLYPQKTGYPELDRLIDLILEPYNGCDTFTKLRGAYDWCVFNVGYSWSGYTQHWAPAYDKFGIDYDLEKDPAIISPYPKDTINRAYHAIVEQSGVCYDYAILFTVLARYIGIESYTHTGILIVGSWSGHHGWSELILDGCSYIFDPQQDYREVFTRGSSDSYAHFGIPTPNYRWNGEYAVNRQRDSQLFPLTYDQVIKGNVSVISSRSGNVCGVTEKIGNTVTLKSDNPEKNVQTWYCNGEPVCYGPEYTFTVTGDTLIYALFEGDVFLDVTNDWYTDSIMSAYQQGIMLGTSPNLFSPYRNLTRAMLVSMLASIDRADLSKYTEQVLEDVPVGMWYSNSVNWAFKNSITAGVSENRFAPDSVLTREQAVTLIMNYLEYRYKNLNLTAKVNLSLYSDAGAISSFAVDDIQKGIALGIVSGYGNGLLKPYANITRSEAAVMINNLVDAINSNKLNIAA